MLRMLAEETRAKFAMVSDSAGLAEALGLDSLQPLPPELAGF